MDARCFGETFSVISHTFACQLADGTHAVDENDSTVKCMLDSMDAAQKKEVLSANPEEKRREWLTDRADWAALLG